MTRPTERDRVAERLYGALLRIYPPWFRARFGCAMRQTFAEDRDRARTQGRRALSAFWLQTFVEAAWCGVGERLAGDSTR
jgi:hypothetical protein